MKTKAIPAVLADLPVKPVHGNYIFTGCMQWSHAEGLAEAWTIWSRAAKKWADDRESDLLRDLVVLDVSDDFKIYESGRISAGHLVQVYVGETAR